jgi:hypothetical protein
MLVIAKDGKDNESYHPAHDQADQRFYQRDEPWTAAGQPLIISPP